MVPKKQLSRASHAVTFTRGLVPSRGVRGFTRMWNADVLDLELARGL